MTNPDKSQPSGLVAIREEMGRQRSDALRSMQSVSDAADQLAASLRKSRKVLFLGMGASHAVGRAVEPLYRELGIEAIALPLSEQLGQPLPCNGCTIVITSQSGESAEVLRWGAELGQGGNVFGMTLDEGSHLAKMLPCLVGSGGPEEAFAATRSLTVTLALHAAVLERLGVDMGAARETLERPPEFDLLQALAAMTATRTVVTTGRRLLGVAEAMALGLTELTRIPCFALEGGQLRHGPMEMLGPEVGVVAFCGNDHTASLVSGLARATFQAGSPTIVFDASGAAAVEGAVTVALPPATGMAAIFALLPAAQEFMVAFAASRVDNVGTPVRSQKITRIE